MPVKQKNQLKVKENSTWKTVDTQSKQYNQSINQTLFREGLH